MSVVVETQNLGMGGATPDDVTGPGRVNQGMYCSIASVMSPPLM